MGTISLLSFIVALLLTLLPSRVLNTFVFEMEADLMEMASIPLWVISIGCAIHAFQLTRERRRPLDGYTLMVGRGPLFLIPFVLGTLLVLTLLGVKI
ncbi:hypothetical protein [Plasticicumulans acidivorans]|nr:hypothetical protein [Plasticicumulans acidivorans]